MRCMSLYILKLTFTGPDSEYHVIIVLNMNTHLFGSVVTMFGTMPAVCLMILDPQPMTSGLGRLVHTWPHAF